MNTTTHGSQPDPKPITTIEAWALAYIYHEVHTPDGNFEVMTWNIGKTQDECLQKWQKRHGGILPTRVIPMVTPVLA